MMPLVFLVLLLASCFYAFARGGPPERVGAQILLAATIASAVALWGSRNRYFQPEVATMWVDIAMAAAFVALALRAQRFWPMWVAMVQLDIVATHLVMFSPETKAWAYWAVQAVWSYPAPLLLAAGTVRHRARVKRYGSDPAWTAPA